MTLTVEDGTGIADADSYVSVADADTYWTNRPQDANATTWAALTSDKKEGALRTATAYLDAKYRDLYRGIRDSWVQGLEWPRNGGPDTDDLDGDYDITETLPVYDSEGLVLPDLPRQLQYAEIELAVRAATRPLAVDTTVGGRVKRKKLDVLELEYFDDGQVPLGAQYGFVDALLGPILSQPGALSGSPSWNWR